MMLNMHLKPQSRTRSDGFTLLEILIAMAVFAILGVMAYGGLNSVLISHEHNKQQAERLRELQLSLRYLERDITQLVDRPVRNEYGDIENALQTAAQPLLSLTRGGWRNPAGLTRSTLQRVAYDINEENTLIRLVWPTLDGYTVENSLVSPLLTDVDHFQLRFLDQNDEWLTDWPPQNSNQANLSPLPKAVEFTLEAEPWGEVRRVIPTLQ